MGDYGLKHKKMKTIKKIIIACIAIIPLSITSCKKDVRGCTNSSATNFNSKATMDDGSCIIKVYGCMDNTSSNYNPNANVDNGTCQYSGKITFYYNTGNPITTVTIGGQNQQITNFYTTAPSCGSPVGCANFTLPVGTYAYSAPQTPNNKNGTITITKNGCALHLLY